MSFISQSYDKLCNLIIRPPRFIYRVEELGENSFCFQNIIYQRTDVELSNKRGLKIQASHYHPKNQEEKLPCVIYCHGNCGSRLDAIEPSQCLLSFCTVFSLDFTGSGLSEGQWVSLGHFEKDDLSTAVSYLRSTNKVSTIGLWGRSMGAATSIFYGIEDPSIAGMVLDSCYSSLSKVSLELVEKVQSRIPKVFVNIGLKLVRNSIKNKANFDINLLEPIKLAQNCFIPALFVHGISDNFISPYHSQRLYEKYSGDKNLILLEGDHNSARPSFFYDSVAIFFHNTLLQKSGHEESTPQIDNWPCLNQKNYHKTYNPFFSIELGELETEENRELQEAISESLRITENKKDSIEAETADHDLPSLTIAKNKKKRTITKI